MTTPFIEALQKILESIPSDMNIQESLALLFDKSHYGCQKEYPVAVVHEKTRITDPASLAFFEQNDLIDPQGFTPCIYSDTQIEQIVSHAPSYIQRVDYIVSKNKIISKPEFFNKFKLLFYV